MIITVSQLAKAINEKRHMTQEELFNNTLQNIHDKLCHCLTDLEETNDYKQFYSDIVNLENDISEKIN